MGLRQKRDHGIVNLDVLTYAANPLSLASLEGDAGYSMVCGDIGDGRLVRDLLLRHHPRAVVNFAAESHVDRSIDEPDIFIQTNVLGTHHLLREVLAYWEDLPSRERVDFRFLHVSTDEVYGSLEADAPPFLESSPYAPNSPYSASKAASDHLVRAYHHTYGLPVLITHCSNNYGPRQFPEKLIPLVILNAVAGKPLPVYGDGLNVRDWLYVEDHCEALLRVLEGGRVGEVYNIGGRCEKTNLETVGSICGVLDERLPESPHRPHASLITMVEDRLGHDRRYAIDCSKMERELDWRPRETFASGIEKTVQWYLDNDGWIRSASGRFPGGKG